MTKTQNQTKEKKIRFNKITWRDKLRVLWYNFTIAYFPTGPAGGL